jgi:hypothetical protein
MTARGRMPEHGEAGNAVLARALAYAGHGWPVFPCQPGRKVPAASHGFLDATTDQDQITAWFEHHPDLNLAVATGWPGPDVLDVDKHETGHGFAALNALARAGLADGAAAWVRTPSGGVHGYFAGSRQRSGHLPACHLDFLSAGGYVLVPPSRVNGRPYLVIAAPRGHAGLDWNRSAALLEPNLQPHRAGRAGGGADPSRLAAWVARLREGNRNAGLFWAANRAIEAGQEAQLDSLAAAARQAGLGDREIRSTLDSARRSAGLRQLAADRQAEAGS